jgi:hypothetical protein
LNDFLLDIVARSNCQRSQKILYTIELQIVWWENKKTQYIRIIHFVM